MWTPQGQPGQLKSSFLIEPLSFEATPGGGHRALCTWLPLSASRDILGTLESSSAQDIMQQLSLSITQDGEEKDIPIKIEILILKHFNLVINGYYWSKLCTILTLWL